MDTSINLRRLIKNGNNQITKRIFRGLDVKTPIHSKCINHRSLIKITSSLEVKAHS
jgi:hypothetical protein